MRFKSIIAPTLLAALGASLLIQLPMAIAGRANDYDWIDPIIDVRRLLLDHFVRQPDEQAMQEAMLEAMVSSMNDPYTVYVPPASEDDFNKSLRGSYVGIGAEVRVIDDYLTIISPMDDSPSLAAGLRAGDVVLDIGGTSTFEKSVEDCIELLMGEPGTTVLLRVRRTNGAEESVQIERQRIQTHTIKGLLRDEERWIHCVDDALGLHYVRITQFNANTLSDLNATLANLRETGLNGLVLDLRDNPGGSLDQAIDMADLFVDEGTILTVRGRQSESGPGARPQRTWEARRAGTLPPFPMVVLINERSASASEIVAGTLQDHGRARVLGSRSYGKGSVQEVRQLPFNRGTLKYTSGYYYTPGGRRIHREPGNESDIWGVDPDPGMVVDMPIEQYVDMVGRRRIFEVIGDHPTAFTECGSVAWIRENFGDEQLALAVEALASKVRGDDWPQVGAHGPIAAALGDELESQLDRRARLIEQLQLSDRRIAQLRGSEALADRVDLVPDDIDLTDGVLVLRDKYGNEIGSYRIESGDVELALGALQLERVGSEPDDRP